ncbi:uncharacterized protein LOC101452293 [Ceratitis capitata]|uniref:uncharacterized protein LOC101452293 n=1 Tax=Ceratitis capitata TaxID=7213 RepID=UPI0003298906|nr:uncharacterized protein LOC101452293 [Ceratitis capitata]
MLKNICYSQIGIIIISLILINGTYETQGVRFYTKERILHLRENVRAMFHHAYEGYLQYADGYDELRPLTCDGVDTWGSYSLTLIDALDTLATMGNYTEFRRVVKIIESMDFDKDINVSVFETNIRILGGLLSAHMLSKQAGVQLEQGWPCQGPLLRLAEDVARRLLPAFDTATGMPYGTVNLRYGVPKGETPVTCTAGVGTFLVEFGSLSRLTGNSIYEDVALNAVYSLWGRRSGIGLFGNHIDVQTGRWTALDSGIGAGVDSFFEYLVKGAIMLNRPELMEMFHEARRHIDKYLKKEDWYIWAHMNKGHVTLPVFQSLEAFWPGVLSMFGDIAPAMRTLVKYSTVWRKYGFLPEFYNIPLGEASVNREVYPLRPELIESVMYLYRATKNQFLLELGEDIIQSIEFSAKTRCGYATIRNVVTHEKENRMESFFLSETTKYLYLLFDEENFLHNDGAVGDRLQTPHGDCAVNAGSYIFNTEAHPVDMSALYCCHDIHDDIFDGLDIGRFSDEALLKNERERLIAEREISEEYTCSQKLSEDTQEQQRQPKTLNTTTSDNKFKSVSIAPVDIDVFDEYDNPAGDLLVENFERVKSGRNQKAELVGTAEVVEHEPLSSNHLTVTDLTKFFAMKRDEFIHPELALHYVQGFMYNFTLDPPLISGLQLLHKNITAVLGIAAQKEYESRTRTVWELYELQQQYLANIELITRLDILAFDDNDIELLDRVLAALNHSGSESLELSDVGEDASLRVMVRQMSSLHTDYQQALLNTTAMQEFLLKILINGTSDKNRTYIPLLNNEEIRTLFEQNDDKEKYATQSLFAHVRRIVEFKKRLMETFDRLQKLMAENGVTKSPKSVNSNEVKQFAKTQTEKHNILAAKNQNNEAKETAEEDGGGDSVWTQLVHTILRKTTNQRNQFNEALLHEKARMALQNYPTFRMTNSTAKVKTLNGYEVFTCDAPEFLDKFAYREYYP